MNASTLRGSTSNPTLGGGESLSRPKTQKSVGLYLSLGSNLGNRKRLVSEAIDMIDKRVGHVVRSSSLYETEPWGFSSPNKFINACVYCETALTPREVLNVTQEIEKELGRTGKSVNGEYHDRVIDIDILLYGDEHIDEPDMKIPHPRMRERDFVMRPLREILI